MPSRISNSPVTRYNSNNNAAYTVRAGDSLSSIANQHSVTLAALRQSNPQLSGDTIRPGQHLQIPQDSAASNTASPSPQTSGDSYYRVRSGDSLSSISRSHGVDVATLLRANPQIDDANDIHPDENLLIPGQSTHNSPTMNNLALLRANNSARSDHSQSAQSLLKQGSTGPEVADMQNRLNHLGFSAGEADGQFGGGTKTALIDFQRSQHLEPDGQLGPNSRHKLEHPDMRAIDQYLNPGYERLSVYRPGSRAQINLFTEAAKVAGVPRSWASDPGLISLLRHESHGKVGVPNYTYGRRANDPSQWSAIHAELRRGHISAKSSATGLGQLLLTNVDRFYPSGRSGIGDPFEEAVGMLRYIKSRHHTPAQAWRNYNSVHEGY